MQVAAVQPQSKLMMRSTCKDSWRHLMVWMEMGGLERVRIWFPVQKCLALTVTDKLRKPDVTSSCYFSLIKHTLSIVS